MEQLKISPEDQHLTTDYPLYLDSSTGYYEIYIDKKTHWLHRYIMEAKRGEIVDHKNRDKKDNRRENLRIVSKSLNNYNRKSRNPLGRGIYYDAWGKRYRACISHNNQTIKLGSFQSPEDAKKAYNIKAKEIYGEDAFQHRIFI